MVLDPRLARNAQNLFDVLMGKSFHALTYDHFVPDLDTARNEIRQVWDRCAQRGRSGQDLVFLRNVPASFLPIFGPPGSGKTRYAVHVALILALQCNTVSAVSAANATVMNLVTCSTDSSATTLWIWWSYGQSTPVRHRYAAPSLDNPAL